MRELVFLWSWGAKVDQGSWYGESGVTACADMEVAEELRLGLGFSN